jgi:hypothetical protein
MKLFSLIITSIIVASCNNQGAETNHDTAAKSTPEKAPDSLCFRRLEGTGNQDTTILNLFLNGNVVTGDMNWLPKEKDSRKGTIKGSRNGDVIKALWSFMQEGMNDTLSVEFKLTQNGLLQKTSEIDATTGRQFLSKKSSFSIPFEKVACKF